MVARLNTSNGGILLLLDRVVQPAGDPVELQRISRFFGGRSQHFECRRPKVCRRRDFEPRAERTGRVPRSHRLWRPEKERAQSRHRQLFGKAAYCRYNCSATSLRSSFSARLARVFSAAGCKLGRWADPLYQLHGLVELVPSLIEIDLQQRACRAHSAAASPARRQGPEPRSTLLVFCLVIAQQASRELLRDTSGGGSASRGPGRSW